MVFKATLPIELSLLTALDALLDCPFGSTDFFNDVLIEHFKIPLGSGYLVDVQVFNAGEYRRPHIDAILLHNGHVITCINPDHTHLEGEYSFDVKGNQFIVEIVPAKS